MKKVFKSSILIALLLLVSTFFSCKNFFGGSELKEELENAINYAKSDSITVIISAENPAFGSVIGNSELKVKITDEIKLQFNCNENYVFTGWKVFVAGEEDESGDYIEVYEPLSLKTSAKIKKYAETIIVRPECFDYLRVDSVSPDWGEIYSKDSAVVANFNSQIDISNFRFSLDDFEKLGYVKTVNDEKVLESYVKTYSDSEGNIYAYELYDDDATLTYKNITITNEDNNFLHYFGIPVVNQNVLTIPVDYKKLIPLEDGELLTMSVSLSKEVASVNGIKMRADKSWLYKITNELELLKDETAPEVVGFKAAKNSTTLAENKVFVEKAIDDFTKDEYLKNGITDSLFVSFQSKDLQSGIKKLVIAEKMINDRTGTPTPEASTYTTDYLYDSLKFSSDGLIATLETDYKIKTADDGAILFNSICCR